MSASAAKGLKRSQDFFDLHMLQVEKTNSEKATLYGLL